MSERIDHAEEARRILSDVKPYQDQHIEVGMGSAQVHATLALVEQQRIANLIALVAADPDGLGRSAYSALAVMSSDRQRTILDPDIAAALGIGDDDE